MSTSRLPPGNNDEREKSEDAEPGATASWGSQLNLTTAPTPAENILELDYEENKMVTSELCVSKDDVTDDKSFIPSVQAAKPGTLVVTRDEGAKVRTSPTVCMDVQTVCKLAASRLNTPWHEVVSEITRSCYEGKKLPQVTRMEKRRLPVFPETLDKVTVSWKDCPFSEKTQIHGASSLDFEGMEKLDIHRMLPIESLVTANLHPWLPTSSRTP